MLEVLLQVGDLAGKLSLGGTVLGVFLLDLWHVLELDGLTFEDSTLHVLYQTLLLLAEEIVLELHSVDLLSHGDNILLSDLWVKSLLHLLL